MKYKNKECLCHQQSNKTGAFDMGVHSWHLLRSQHRAGLTERTSHPQSTVEKTEAKRTSAIHSQALGENN